MARPSRSKRQAERARVRQTAGDAGAKSALRPARKGRPARALNPSGSTSAQAGALSGGVPVVVKVGVVAVLILLAVFLASLGR